METTAVTQLPALTEDVTNGIEVFFYDVSQYNGNSANFFDSIARVVNKVIDAMLSCEKYFIWIDDIASTVYNSNAFPVWFGSAVSVGLFFLLYNFIRNR